MSALALACNGAMAQGTGVQYAEAKSIIKNFCAFNDGTKLSPDINISSKHKTSIGNSDIILSISYTTASDFSNKGCNPESSTQLTIVQSGCERTLYRLLDECDTDPRFSGKYGGNVTSDCGLYAISTEIEEIVRCGGNPWARPIDLPLDIMTEGIDAYCGTSLDLTPDFSLNDRFLTAPRSGQSFDNYVKDSFVVKSVTQFSGQGQTDCPSSKPFNTKGEECRRKLQTIRDRCGGQGGGLSENGANGCVLWTVWGQRAH